MIDRDWTVKLWLMRPASPIHVVAEVSSPTIADAIKAAEDSARWMYGGEKGAGHPAFTYSVTTRKPNPVKEVLS